MGRAPRHAKPRNGRWRPGEQEEFREALLHKRSQLVADAAGLRREALRADGSGDTSEPRVMPTHMADWGTDAWEQELTLGLMADRQALLREVEHALWRIEIGTYGVCEATHKPIPKARLRAIPWARYCVEHARKLEPQAY